MFWQTEASFSHRSVSLITYLMSNKRFEKPLTGDKTRTCFGSCYCSKSAAFCRLTQVYFPGLLPSQGGVLNGRPAVIGRHQSETYVNASRPIERFDLFWRCLAPSAGTQH
jgi:hypothetical protein